MHLTLEQDAFQRTRRGNDHIQSQKVHKQVKILISSLPTGNPRWHRWREWIDTAVPDHIVDMARSIAVHARTTIFRHRTLFQRPSHLAQYHLS
jgi:hypothetical protein